MKKFQNIKKNREGRIETETGSFFCIIEIQTKQQKKKKEKVFIP